VSADLAAFLRARLDEDEYGPWPHRSTCQMLRPVPENFPFATFSCDCDLAARWAREVEAKRQVVDYLASELADDPTSVMDQDLLRALAAVYSDHPDYREEWRP